MTDFNWRDMEFGKILEKTGLEIMGIGSPYRDNTLEHAKLRLLRHLSESVRRDAKMIIEELDRKEM